jgi:hypothetical protein
MSVLDFRVLQVLECSVGIAVRVALIQKSEKCSKIWNFLSTMTVQKTSDFEAF